MEESKKKPTNAIWQCVMCGKGRYSITTPEVIKCEQGVESCCWELIVDFCLHKYTSEETRTWGMVAPQKYRVFSKVPKYQKEAVAAWNKDKSKIAADFVNQLENIYSVEEPFLLFTPATGTPFFVDDIIAELQKKFPDMINLSGCFTKNNPNDKFGSEELKDLPISELLGRITVNQNKLKPAKDMEVKKAFILDDVFSSGRTLAVAKQLIRNNFGENIEVRSGVLLGCGIK